MGDLFILLLVFVGSILMLAIGQALVVICLMARNTAVYIMRKRGYKRFKMIRIKEYL